MVVPEIKLDSKEDADDLVYASFIRARTKPVVTLEPPIKRPTTQLQQKEALEFALKKSKRSRRRRMLVKDGKVVQAKDVPVVDVDEETKEEPSSLTRKSSRKKQSVSQSEKHTSKGAESSSKSAIAGSNKKLVKNFGDKTVKECSDKSDEKEVEKSSEHIQNKLVEKETSIGKSVKRKRDDDDEEPGSIKKGKVSGSLRSKKRKLGNQKVL
ncbi:protein pxr1-like [Nicotiana sylvestris]|uniref:protein pxr1-like n=1 Tax=Nicotiana sylvestris TaxID=4096 RepID=UPI00388CC5DD